MSATLRSPVRAATTAMGTRFEIVIATDDAYGAHPFIEAALREIEDLHAKLTRFSPDSVISHVNRVAAHTPVRLDSDTFELLRAASQLKQHSNGAFDVALGTGEILLGRSERTVAFDRPGVCIDLGGIAKGHALDRAADILREGGVESALLHGGTSSVLAIGAPPDARAWRVALALSDGQPCVELCDNALSVSRPCSQLVDDRSHIVDARCRDRVLRPCTAAVVGPSASMTDAWSTALAVLGRRPEGLGEEWTTYIEFERD